MTRLGISSGIAQHAPHNAMDDPGEIAAFYDHCSDLMRELLDGLAAAPDQPRPFPEIEDSIGWPRRRIASVLGGASHMRHTLFAGRRPYRFKEPRQTESRRWEMWCDARQAEAITEAQVPEPGSGIPGGVPQIPDPRSQIRRTRAL